MKLIRKWIAALCITGLILWPQQAFASVSLFPALLRDPLLTLVNKDHPLSENWVMELTEIEEGYQVDRRMAEDLNAMFSDMRAEGLQPMICSAYRSYEMQAELHEREVEIYLNQGLSGEEARTEAGFWVAVPGCSEHQMGLAVDIVDASWPELDQSQEQTAEQQWLMAHCAEYGFILRYPVDKSEITGIGYEPWHYRYVGKRNAGNIMDSGLCLEEYLDLLEQNEKAPFGHFFDLGA